MIKVWLVTIGEPLPISGNKSRLHRTGMFAEHLVRSGMAVTWWSSDFDHFKKEHLSVRGRLGAFEEKCELILLSGKAYRRNVSISRLINHLQIGLAFRKQSSDASPPDIIVSAMPTIELSYIAARLAKRLRVPCVIDVRDLWPDIFSDALPKQFRFFGRLLLTPYHVMLKRALSDAAGVIAVSDEYLKWALNKVPRPATVNDRVFPLGYKRPSKMSCDEDQLWNRLSAFGIKRDIPIIWFVGTFGRSYDLITVLEAARLLSKRSIKVQFVLSGDGENGKLLHERATGISNVVFSGWLGSDQLHDLMRVSSVGLAAYVKGAPQGIPNKIVEYMAAELPILSCLSGETERLLESTGTGLTYEAANAESLATKVEQLMANPAMLNKMASHSKRTFHKLFAAEVINADMQDYLSRLVLQNKSQSR